MSQKSTIFAANIFAIAAKNIGLFGAMVLGGFGDLLLAIRDVLCYHFAWLQGSASAECQKRIRLKRHEICLGSAKLTR